MKGTVIRLVKEKPFGFLRGEDGNEYFFHASSVVNGSFNDVKYGQTVEFEPSESEKGLRAEDVYI